MTTEAELLRAVLSEPESDSPGIAYADWLEEQGQGDRAEFIRVQCELARIDREEDAWHRPYFVNSERVTHEPWGTLRRREGELLKFLCATLDAINSWLGVRPSTAQLKQEGPHWTLAVGLRTKTTLDTEIFFRRGFVQAITLTAADFLEHADTLCWHPRQKCRACGDKGYWNSVDLYGVIPQRNRCSDCRGTGKRPCPETAQPIRAVTLTKWPDPNRYPVLQQEGGSALFAAHLAAEWPGITFRLPDQP